MYSEQYSAVSRPQFGLRALKERVRNQISFWLWDRKLSKQYNDIMKQSSVVERVTVVEREANSGADHV